MRRIPAAGLILRYLCLLTALANIGGNIGLQLGYPLLFNWLGVPPPVDARLFAIESALSFSMGVVALLIFFDTARAIPLLQIGALGKGAYAIVTSWHWALHGLHWFYLVFAVWDAVFVVIFILYWIYLESRDLTELQQSIFDGIDRPRTNRALIIGFSLTDNGRKVIHQLEAGLRNRGYQSDVIWVVAQESIFRFPMSLMDFVRIILRAFLRRPAKIAPLRVPRDDYDLVVVESPTWLLSMGAPVEAVFLDPANRRLFEGRDAVALAMSRGAYQRTAAMIVRWLERSGANVVAARGYTHVGREPRRLMSLWFYLIFRKPGFPPGLAEPHYGVSQDTLDAIANFGEDLAERSRTRPHWTLLKALGAALAP
ncbi:MAG: hypothetical protein AAB225_09795 [Acidobacteriota bacterium]